mmetsp:Transcript_28829/g.81222  ORF Transcript_28829/g.81222 Transcript_28829/m.81222 type:complete len:254 (-) Transcript_28829:479-1240(-)
MDTVVALITDGKHPSLGTHVAQVGSVESLCELHHCLVVDVSVLGDPRGVDLQDVHAGLLVGQRDLHLTVQATGAEKGWVKDIGAVGRHDHFHLSYRVKPIQLAQQLHERALDLAICRSALAEAAATDGVNLVHEDDAGLVVAGVAKHLTDEARALANILVDNGRGNHLEEVGLDVGCNGTGKQGLPGARRPVKQDTLWRLDAYAEEQLRIDERELNALTELSDLLAKTTDGAVVHLSGVLLKHVVYHGINLSV